MARFVEGMDRGQVTLLPECLEDWVDENNPVRVVDVFVEALDLVELGFDDAQPMATGRPGYKPSVLLKLYVTGNVGTKYTFEGAYTLRFSSGGRVASLHQLDFARPPREPEVMRLSNKLRSAIGSGLSVSLSTAPNPLFGGCSAVSGSIRRNTLRRSIPLRLRASLCRCRWSRGRQLDHIAALQCLGRAIDHPILRIEAGRHLDGVTEIPAELDRLEHHLVSVSNNRDLHAAVDRRQRRGWNAHRVWVTRNLEVDPAIGAADE